MRADNLGECYRYNNLYVCMYEKTNLRISYEIATPSAVTGLHRGGFFVFLMAQGLLAFPIVYIFDLYGHFGQEL